MVEAKFNSEEIASLVRHGLTLRYDPTGETRLPVLSFDDFLPSKGTVNIDYIEKNLVSTINEKLGDSKDVTIALSSGVDSTLICGLLRRTIPDLKINAVSVRFAGSKDEVVEAKKIADFFEAEHEVVELDNYLLELPRAINTIGLPFWDIHWWYIANYAKTKSSFIASGDGGDELFGGYTFRYLKFLSLINNDSSPLEKVKAYLACHERDWVVDQMKLFGEGIEFSWDSIYSMFLPYFDNSLSPINQVFLADYNGKLSHNFSVVSQKINDLFHLRSVVPLLNDQLIKYSASLSPELKYDRITNSGKLVLKKVLSKFGVDSLVSKEKYGFSVNTINLWNSYGRELCNSYLDNGRIIEDKLIDKKWVWDNINRPELDVRYVNKFLGLLAMEVWYRIFITKEMSPLNNLS